LEKLIASGFGTALEGKIFSKFRKEKNPTSRKEKSFQSLKKNCSKGFYPGNADIFLPKCRYIPSEMQIYSSRNARNMLQFSIT